MCYFTGEREREHFSLKKLLWLSHLVCGTRVFFFKKKFKSGGEHFPGNDAKKSFSGCNGCAKNELYSIFAFVIRTCLEVEIEFWKKLKTKILGCKKKL